MQTRIKWAGGSYFSDKVKPIWEGTLPLLPGPGMNIELEADGDRKENLILKVTMVNIEIAGPDSWQVVYVAPGDPATAKLAPKELLG